ncbi:MULTISPECIES: hypothetical protein [unclassified Clostridium]|uniref:hypothetical protein n=1 Tax=unclassified Clostridium TaxID=2614128 RepID=UPI00207AE50B|nr:MULTISPECIES: hypothetical protein [unclassified Clostridium]
MNKYSYLDDAWKLFKYIKFESEGENIEIYTNLSVYEVNYNDDELQKKVYEIFDNCKKNNELILGVKWYA